MKDGDHPDNIIVTYARCNSAAQLVEDLMRVVAPSKWSGASEKMMSRDLLVDDEWWSSVIRMRDRKLRKAPERKLPSSSTRVTAGHMMAVAARALAIQKEDIDDLIVGPDMSDLERDANPPDGGWDMRHAAQKAYELSGGQCEAHGFHDADCPGEITISNANDFSVHHRYTREQAKRYKVPMEFIDRPSNLIVVWNRYPLGANGCHGKIHREATGARAAGLLCEKGEYPIDYSPDTD